MAVGQSVLIARKQGCSLQGAAVFDSHSHVLSAPIDVTSLHWLLQNTRLFPSIEACVGADGRSFSFME